MGFTARRRRDYGRLVRRGRRHDGNRDIGSARELGVTGAQPEDIAPPPWRSWLA